MLQYVIYILVTFSQYTVHEQSDFIMNGIIHGNLFPAEAAGKEMKFRITVFFKLAFLI